MAHLLTLGDNNDSLLTGIYRPVSVLTRISEVFEKFTTINYMSISKKYWPRSWLPSENISAYNMSF